MIILKLTSHPPLSLLLCSTYLQYLRPTYFIGYARIYVILHDFSTKYTKSVLVGSPAVLVRDKIHCNEYPGTRRVMSVGYPGSKISIRFNPIINICYSIGIFQIVPQGCVQKSLAMIRTVQDNNKHAEIKISRTYIYIYALRTITQYYMLSIVPCS